MNVPINSRDLLLQATAIRVLGISTNYINLTCPTQQFKYGTDNVAQPSSTIVTATLVGALQGTVTFTTSGFNPAPTSTTNQLTINPDNITGDFATISATLTYQGESYTAVPISVSKIFNQLVARITTPIDQVPSYSDGTGYTLPTADNFIELYNGVVKLTSGVVYGPATQTKNGLIVTVNSATGKITASQANPNTWTSSTENFTLTAVRGGITYTATYTVAKAKQGFGGQQLADITLYQWSTAQPAVPLGTSTYTWDSKAHSYTDTDDWRTTVSANPGTVGIKLWEAGKGIIAASEATAPTYSTTWTTGTTVRQVTTDANKFIKTKTVIVYKNDISPPTIAGTSTYNWTPGSISAAPANWELTASDTPPGFTLYQAAVDLLAAQSETSSQIDWTRSSITPVRYSGGNGVASIIADLTNATHAIPTDSTGTTINFANSGSDLFVYEGATPLEYDEIGTATGTYKVTVTGNAVDPGTATKITVDGVKGVRFGILTGAAFATNTTGKITYVISGRRLTTDPGVTLGTPFTYTVDQTFTKTPSGIQGVPGVAYWVITSASVIQKNISNVFNPSTVTISGKQSAGAAASNYSAYFKIFKNSDTSAAYTSSVAEASTTYTVEGATTTSIRVNMYSDSGFTNLLDQEIIPIVSDGGTGQTGASARRAYVVATTTPSGTPDSLTVTGDNLPTAGTWFVDKTYSASAPTAALAAGESLYQSDGVYVSGGSTTWGFPYLSSLKVGNLQAISANTGALTVTGNIKGGAATALATGTGYYFDSDGKFRVGTADKSRLVYDTGLTLYDKDGNVVITTDGKVNWSAVSGTTDAPQSNSTRNVFRGTWVTGTDYVVGDIVAYGDNTYSCIVASTGTIVPTNTNFWVPYAASGSSVKLQYSTTNTLVDSTWHDLYAAGDLYVRSGVRAVGGTTYTFGTGTKFVPVLGTDYYQPATFDITNSGATFKKDTVGAITPASITLTTAFANIVSPSYQWYKDGTTISGATSSSYAVDKADYASSSIHAYKCVVTGTISGTASSTREDTVTIPLLLDGSSAIQVLNSNENITFTADTTGYSGITFTSGESVIRAYIGTTALSYATTGANTFSATNASTGATVATGTGTGTTFTVPAPSAMSTETATTTVTLTIRDAASNVTTVTTVISYSLSRKGIKPVLGVDYYQPATFDITNSGATFKKDAAGTVTPDSITLTTASANIVSPSYQWYRDGTAINITNDAAAAGTDTTYGKTANFTVLKADYTSATSHAYKCIVTGTINGTASSTREDTLTIPLLIDGSSAIQILATNENVLLPATNTGYTGITFTGSGVVITAYIGTTQLSYATTGANTFNVTGFTGTTTPGPGSTTIDLLTYPASTPVGSGNVYTISAPTAMTVDTVTATFSITVRNGAGTATSLTKNIKYTLSRAGVKGNTPVVGVDFTQPSNGDPGARGSLTGFALKYSMYGAWSDAKANRTINNMVSGATLGTDLTTTTHLRIGDTVTITNGSTAALSTNAVTKYWDGDSWEEPGVVFNGNVLVNGTITADKLAANQILVGHEIKNSAGTFIINFGSSPYISISV